MPGTILAAFLPPDDMSRDLSVANADAPGMRHVSVAGDTYTILLTGADTGGRYCLIDMHVPPGGAPHPTAMISRKCSPSSTAKSK
jgi:hypothetical protein